MGKIAITRWDWCRDSSPCGSDYKAGSGEEAGSGNAAFPLRQRSVFATLLSHQCSAFTAYQTYLRYKAWVAQRHQTMSPLVQPGLHISHANKYDQEKTMGYDMNFKSSLILF